MKRLNMGSEWLEKRLAAKYLVHRTLFAGSNPARLASYFEVVLVVGR